MSRDWELIGGVALMVCVDGATINKEAEDCADQIKNTILHYCVNDFFEEDPKRFVEYRINVQVHKAEGEQLHETKV